MRGEVSVERFGRAAAHLATGCPACWAAIRAARAWLAPSEPLPADAYDRPIERAFTVALRAAREIDRRERLIGSLLPSQRHLGEGKLERAAQRRRLESERRYDAAPLGERYEAHRRISWEARFTDPDRMVEHAGLAHTIAQFILRPEEVGGAAPLADLRAQATGELANAWRVRNEYPKAWRNLMNAFALRLEGTGDEALHARLLDIQASYHADRRELPEAHAALDRALSLYQKLGLDRLEAKLLVQKGIYYGYSEKPELAVAQLEQALERIDPELDPDLDLAVRFNLASYLIDAGDLRAARRQTWGLAARFAERGQILNSAKILWLEGKIHRELGELERAEREIARARAGFAEAGDQFLCGLTGLELALLAHRREAVGEAVALATEALQLFRALEIGRDALAALTLLETLLGDGRMPADRLALAFEEFEAKARAAWSARPRKRRQIWLDP